MSTSTLSDLLAQKAALEQQIADVKRAEYSEAVAKVRSLMSEYGLTLADIGATPKAASLPKKAPSKVAAKYRDPVSGSTWSGRGLKPKWLSAALASGRSLSDFAL